MEIKIRRMKAKLVKAMYGDEFYPVKLVDKVRDALLELCTGIEKNSPETLEELYDLADLTVERINELQSEFFKSGSEIETNARGIICGDLHSIALAYGFEKADRGEMSRDRDW